LTEGSSTAGASAWSSLVAAAAGGAATTGFCLGRGDMSFVEDVLPGDAGGEARLGWRFSWSAAAARGEVAAASAERERDACRFRFRRSISIAAYFSRCKLLTARRRSGVEEIGMGRRRLVVRCGCVEVSVPIII
jgi:hypothetical protein